MKNNINRLLGGFFALIMISCADNHPSEQLAKLTSTVGVEKTSIVILGTAQDAGSPQIGCKKACCVGLFENPDKN